ncbi:sortase B [Moryella indoligenes]|uniref:Sortase B n=1 Tax=Moryella indoligenes TaxID=371674 RepID=A0AAE4AM65_9FIRM|nr:class B sortase [Moryella indoligenes]MDQ0152801.1 sortase B [Moryella indoligenes]
MKKITRRHALLLLLIAVLALLCGLKLAERAAHIRKYEALSETVTRTEEEAAPVDQAKSGVIDPDAERIIDFAALKERNEDVVAWLYIPGTVINYPILWKEADNDYYLRRDIDRTEGSYDGVYLDGDDLPDFSKLQNLFYGHHMKNKTMFTAICDFKDERFFQEHSRAYLYTEEKTFILRPIACLYTDAGAEKRRIDFADRMEFDAYVDAMTAGCSFRDIPAQGVDRLFSFVTCSYEFDNARTILYCCETDAAGHPVKPGEITPAVQTAEGMKGDMEQ